MAEEVGVGYIRLIPSMKGFSAAASREIDGALSGPAKRSGEDAGDKITSGIGDGVKGGKGKISGASERVGEWFKTGLAAAGIAAGVLLAGGIAQSLSNEVDEKKLAAQLGGGDFGAEMGKIAGDLYAQNFGSSVAETADAVKKVWQGGLLPEDATNEQIERLSGQILTFTDVMEQDMDMATQAVSNMLRTGLAESGQEALDILTAGIQQGADRAGDLAETFQEYSTMFRDIGISGTESMGLLVQGLRAGARDADTVADALKEFAIRAQDGSEASAAGFKAIGLSATEMTAAVAEGGPKAHEALGLVLDGLRAMEDPAERNAAAVALFGTKAEDLGDALFSLDLDTAAQHLGTVEDSVNDLGDAYDTNAAVIESFKRKAMDKLADVVSTKVIPAVQGLAKWAKENPGAFRAMATVVGGVLVVAFAAWAVSAASAAAATIAATWPVLAIAAAVGLLAALVVSHWSKITGFFSAVKNAALGAFNWVKTNWPTLLAILTGPFGLAALAIVKNWQTIRNAATATKDWIGARVGEIVGFVTGLPGKIASAASGMWNGLSSGLASVIRSIASRINGLIRGFNRLPGPDLPLLSAGLASPRTGHDIPKFHGGGTFRADSPGGEGLAWLRDRETVFTPQQMAAMAGVSAAPAAAGVMIDLTGGDSEFLRWLRGRILQSSGGNVQRALGRG